MIQTPDTGHAPGTIVLAAGQPRHHEFIESMENVLVPEGTTYQIIQSCDVAANFNKGIRRMTGQWVWFLGDDHAFAPDTLLRLLGHRMDVVVPISPCKQPFGYPFVLHGTDGDWHDDLQTYSWQELSGYGLKVLPVGDFVGQAGMLVRKPVLDAIGDPWFKCGRFSPGRLQEDMAFCKDVQTHGYLIWIDQTLIFDHYMTPVMTARKQDGRWMPALKLVDHTMVLAGVA